MNSSETRIGKVYDHLLGVIVNDCQWKVEVSDAGRLAVNAYAHRIIDVLAATSDFPDLPNRKRLIELVEAAMPKENVNAEND